MEKSWRQGPGTEESTKEEAGMADSTDVSNVLNSADRWSAALAAYSREQTQGGESPRSGSGTVTMRLVIDCSGSMAGTKITAS